MPWVSAFASAGRDLASEQRRGNDSVEQARARAHHPVPRSAYVVRDSQPRIKILVWVMQCVGRPGLEVPTEPIGHRQLVRGAPFILDKEPVVGVVHGTFGFIANVAGNCRALVDL